MPFVLWTVLSLIAYAVGQILLMRFTPHLLVHNFDEWLFVVFAAAEVFGGILAFGGVAVPMIIFNGAFAARVLAFLLLVGIILVEARLSLRSFRPRRFNTFLISRILAGFYCLLLSAAALAYLILLFILPMPS